MYERKNDTYSFSFFDGSREVLHRFTIPEGMTYDFIVEKFYDFLSGVYGYDMRDTCESRCGDTCRKESIKDYIE